MTGWYRRLLRLLPGDLRARHGAEMEAMYRDAEERARAEGGRRARLRVRAGGVWDVVRRAVYEHLRRVRRANSPRHLMSTIGPDIRFALRGFARRPGITLLAVVMLSLGVAACTAVFTLVDGLFLRPLPFPESERLVYLNEKAPRWNLEMTGINFRDFDAWRENARVFEAMGLITGRDYNVSDGAGAERLTGLGVTHDLADALRIEPVLGRTFTAEEDAPGGPPVVMIGHGLWQGRFGGSRDVLGETIRINSVPHTIVGVLPPHADFPGDVQLWVPLKLDPVEDGGSYSYDGVGRLRPGVTVAQALADLERAHAPIWEEHDPERVVSPTVAPLRDVFVRDYRTAAVALGAAVGLVLLIACANVAGILLARSFTRRRELGIRMAMGAGAGRLARQLFTESLALSAVAGPLGLLLGYWSIRVLARTLPEQLPGWLELSADWRMGLFGLAVIAVAAALFGWAPVFQARRENVREALAEGGGRSGASRGQRRTMNLLVVAEVTLAVLLLVGGGLLLRAFDRLADADPGFRTANVLQFRLALPDASYPDSAATWGFYRELRSRLEALPGVRTAGAITCPPLSCHWGGFFTVDGAPERGPDAPDPVVLYRFATPEYFDAMGVRLVRGRIYEARDAVPSVVVNETFVREIIPHVDDPIGERIRFGSDDDDPLFTVVGVTRDVKHYGLDEPMRPGIYFPFEPRPQDRFAVVLHTTVPPASLVAPARDIVRALDPELPLYEIRTTGEALERSLAVRRAYSWMMAVFAGMALVLALGGIYGVLAFMVGQRTRELGVRVALGATRGDVVRLVVRHGMLLALAGVVIGLVAALAGGRALSSLLGEVSAWDPPTLLGAATLLGVTALIATLVPARRAAAVEPQTVLREE